MPVFGAAHLAGVAVDRPEQLIQRQAFVVIQVFRLAALEAISTGIDANK